MIPYHLLAFVTKSYPYSAKCWTGFELKPEVALWTFGCQGHDSRAPVCKEFTPVYPLVLLVAHHAGDGAEGVGLVAVAVGEFGEEGEVRILG